MFLLCLAASDLYAGLYHSGASMVCSDCHTIHASEQHEYDGTTNVRSWIPSPYLLKASGSNVLCESCHNGSDSNAPDDFSPVLTSYSPDEFSGGGFFDEAVGVDNPKGHNLSVAAATVPLSSLTDVTLTCASCHNPHGTGNYRNLKSSPSGRTSVDIIINDPSQSTDDVFVSVKPDGTNPGAAYRRSNTGYKAKMAAWCRECHDTATNGSGTSPAHFLRHPSDVAVNANLYHTDPTNWTAGTGEGFGTTTGDSTAGVPRTRFQVATATNYSLSTTAANDNQVFCPSCHLAHGSNYKAGLLWPFKEGGADMMSPCQQCHNQ